MQTLKGNMATFKSEIERLQRGLKGSYTKEQIDLLFEQTKKFKTSHLKAAVDHIVAMKMVLPPPNDVVVGCRTEYYGDELREDQEEKKFARNFFDGKVTQKGNMAKKAMGLILSILTEDKEGFFLKPKREMTVPELYQEMLKLDDDYPGVGWGQEAYRVMDIRKKREIKPLEQPHI